MYQMSQRKYKKSINENERVPFRLVVIARHLAGSGLAKDHRGKKLVRRISTREIKREKGKKETQSGGLA